MSQPMSGETDALLTRLSQKPGVQSTLVLSRATGSIVRTTGLYSSSTSPNPNSTLPSSANTNSPGHTRSESQTQTQTQSQTPNGAAEARANNGMQNAEELAGMVWTFVGAAGGLAKGLDGEDEVKLLRLRTRKNELVIVPGEFGGQPSHIGESKVSSTNERVDSKFLLVVIHDTPPA
ncbi:MAG: hypothetical protein M1837_003167 [Sclerophora amabilis]|nr:MAG: hypothetical protein M1837_003167 [Sclerophora amabilis]